MTRNYARFCYTGGIGLLELYAPEPEPLPRNPKPFLVCQYCGYYDVMPDELQSETINLLYWCCPVCQRFEAQWQATVKRTEVA
jgi:hypothetical protein